MEKLATNVDEQIAKLESRGMTIGDKDKAKECLLDIGYFRLGFYWFPFEKSYPRKVNRTHEFKDGTCFEYAIRLYYFDYDLRNILLKYINRVEINFRTKLIYPLQTDTNKTRSGIRTASMSTRRSWRMMSWRKP